jgi:hypothetical protein
MYTMMKGSTNVEELHKLANDLTLIQLIDQVDKLNHMGLIEIVDSKITIKKQI